MSKPASSPLLTQEQPGSPVGQQPCIPSTTGAPGAQAPGALGRLPQVASLPLLALAEDKLDWPEDVLFPMRSGANLCEASFRTSEQALATRGLRLVFGSFQIPHPKKAASGGEDSFFFSQAAGAAGVADGVGEWEWRFGLNPRSFADEMMGGARQHLEGPEHTSASTVVDEAMAALDAGYGSSSSYGSATALVAVLDPTGSELGVASLGDSGLRQIRPPAAGSHDPSALSTRIVGRTTEQQHSFNCPFQLSRLPQPEDFERLLRTGLPGLRKLVRCVQATPTPRQDKPGDAVGYTLKLQEGDLLVLGTDGLFDNLFDRELCELAGLALSPSEVGQVYDPASRGLIGGSGSTNPNMIAESIAKAAFLRSADTGAKTPFGQNAREAGLHHMGGKMDDITVVVAWVVRSSSADAT